MQSEIPLKRNYILTALMLTMMLAAMDTTIVSTAIPQIVSDLGGFRKFSWVFSIYLLAQTVTIPLYGKLADLFGRKRILLAGTAIFLLGSASSAAAWNLEALILFRAVQGLGAGSIMASVNTIAGDIYTVTERARVQGLLSSTWGVSAIVGPAIGGALTEFVNWRWIFIINLPIGLLSMAFLAAFFHERPHPGKPQIDYRGAVLILLTIGLFIVFLLEGGQSWPWFGALSLALLATVVLLAFLTIQAEQKAPAPILPPWVWKSRALTFTNLAMVLMGIIMMGPETFLPTFCQAGLGLGIITSGFILASMSFGWPTASALSGRLYLRIGFRDTSLIGAALVAVACAGFLLLSWPQPPWLIVLDQILLGAGFGLLSTPSLVGVQTMVGWEQRGVVTGLNIFCRNLGQSLGAAIFGAIFNNSLQHQMLRAPPGLSASAADVLHALKNPELSPGQKVFLQKAVSASMIHIYLGLVCFAALVVLAIAGAPRRLSPAQTR